MSFPMGVVYCLRQNNRCYIGSTRRPLKHRVSQHLHLAKSPRKGCCASYDIVKAGPGSFQVEVLQLLSNCTDQELRMAEQMHFLKACWTPGTTVLNKNRPSAVYPAGPPCSHSSDYELHRLNCGQVGLV